MTAVKDKPEAANGAAAEPEPHVADDHAVNQDELSIAQDALALKRTLRYDGRLTAELLDGLRELLTEPIPPRYIKHVPKGSQSYKTRVGEEKPWPPHDITGINGAQVQKTRLSNVLGRQHWRKLARYFDKGQLVRVHVVVGNDLHLATLDGNGDLVPNGAEILIAEDGWGGYNKGFDVGYHYKGSETSAVKKVIAAIGPGEEVYRQEVDPELDPDDQEAPAPEAQAVQIPTIDGDRVAGLTDLAQAFVTAAEDPGEQKKRTTQITRLLRSEGLSGAIESVTQGFARLTPVQADNVEGWLREQSKGGEAS